MSDFILEPNEFIVFKAESVSRGEVFNTASNELVLTTQNIVYIKRGIFNKVKEAVKFPLNEIKMYDGEPQVMINRANYNRQVDIYFLNGNESFSFLSVTAKKDMAVFVNEISRIITGHDSYKLDEHDFLSIPVPGVDNMIDVFKGTVDVFKDAFGIPVNEKPVRKKPRKITKQCPSCSAPITGFEGESACCEYCGTRHIL
ncbi:MAG: hypothetical protein ACLRLX_03340 [Anaerovoracaceae bacterium]